MGGEPIGVARKRIAAALAVAGRKLWRRGDLTPADEVIVDLVMESLHRLGAMLRPQDGTPADLVVAQALPDVREQCERLVQLARRGPVGHAVYSRANEGAPHVAASPCRAQHNDEVPDQHQLAEGDEDAKTHSFEFNLHTYVSPAAFYGNSFQLSEHYVTFIPGSEKHLTADMKDSGHGSGVVVPTAGSVEPNLFSDRYNENAVVCFQEVPWLSPKELEVFRVDPGNKECCGAEGKDEKEPMSPQKGDDSEEDEGSSSREYFVENDAEQLNWEDRALATTGQVVRLPEGGLATVVD